MNAYDILKDRGFLYQLTDETVLPEKLNNGCMTYYVGFDPTADSLHIGHLLPIMAMRWLQKCGHRPIALVGGATAMVGDPSGKTEARPILSREQIDANAASIKGQMSCFLDFNAGGALLLNNADWLSQLNYIEFLRDVGCHFSINRMLSAESVKLRLETGLSFLEFNYMLLQAYDYYLLSRDYDCTLQLGGQDQWGNIVAGVDLNRRMLRREVYGATFPLLLKSDGEKFGKTAGGAVWLDSNRTSAYDYFQFWRNVDDSEVQRLLAFFTMLPMPEVRRLAALPAPAINRAKEILAYEATVLAHGEAAAQQAYLAAASHFGFADPQGGIATSSAITSIKAECAATQVPSVMLAKSELADGLWVVKLFVDAGLCASNSDARRLINGGGAYINEQRVVDDKLLLHEHDAAAALLLRAGKKKVLRVEFA